MWGRAGEPPILPCFCGSYLKTTRGYGGGTSNLTTFFEGTLSSFVGHRCAHPWHEPSPPDNGALSAEIPVIKLFSSGSQSRTDCTVLGAQAMVLAADCHATRSSRSNCSNLRQLPSASTGLVSSMWTCCRWLTARTSSGSRTIIMIILSTACA